MALHSAHGGRGSLTAAMANGLDHVLDTLALWRHRVTTRRELSRLDERMMRDIGVSPLDVEVETAKHFWQE
ncbi:DUF1127 domain-containing protein [Azospirillum halopraeferens]|uniref:DUF1127 domain-containing protein n=1 Tax=Azospirillum halopraeferens TaxID=34010 RepID=UPI00054F8BDC|nr:DUF1127 domain-containing protein [Azospirillum halopraeferens]